MRLLRSRESSAPASIPSAVQLLQLERQAGRTGDGSESVGDIADVKRVADRRRSPCRLPSVQRTKALVVTSLGLRQPGGTRLGDETVVIGNQIALPKSEDRRLVMRIGVVCIRRHNPGRTGQEHCRFGEFLSRRVGVEGETNRIGIRSHGGVGGRRPNQVMRCARTGGVGVAR